MAPSEPASRHEANMNSAPGVAETITWVGEVVWRKWHRRAGWTHRVDKDDALQAAFAKCWAARDLYDPARGVPATTYFHVIARREISRLARQRCARRIRRVFSIDARTRDGTRARLELVDVPADRDLEHAEDLAQLRRGLAELEPITREVLLRLAGGETLQSVGDSLGCTRQAVHSRQNTAIRKLTRYLEKDRIQP